MVRRLERLETDLLAERHARVDDLALLVELITGQWRAMNERLDRIERALDRRARDGRPAPARADTRLDRRSRTALRAGRTSSNREPRPTSESRSIRPPSARRELLRDREPEPGAAAPPRRTAGRAARAVSGAIPGPVSSTATWTVPFVRCELEADPAAVGRRAERVREQVVDDLEHAVAVGDDHRLRADVDAVVDRAPPRLAR